MESFIFNSFKKRLLEGKVKLDDYWYHYPVNKKFVSSYGNDAQYMETSASFIMYDLNNNPNEEYHHENTTNDTYLFNKWYDHYKTNFTTYEYRYKPMGDQDIASKPEFVTKDGWANFSDKDKPTSQHLYDFFFVKGGHFYKPSGFYDKNTGEEIPKGFYYVKIKEELVWCANKVNDSTIFDNEISIVLGDNIGTATQTSVIKSCIGSNPAQPFNGIFFGNGYGFVNCELHCKNDVGGIIGYLGKNNTHKEYVGANVTPGTISHVWVKNCSIVNEKDISLTHLVTGGFDVAAGFLCGKNDGLIENVYIFDNFGISGFVPKMYSCSSKVDRPLNVATGDPEACLFYPDYLCYNSLGNIVPYVGYFNEGVFATYSGYSKVDKKMHTYWNTSDISKGYPLKKSDNRPSITSPMQWGYTVGLDYHDPLNNDIGGRLFHFTAPANRKNVLWYDSYIVDATLKTHNGSNTLGIGSGDNEKMHGVLLIRDSDWMQNFKAIEYAQYFDKSIKMNQQNRAAYYVSPLVGINTGTVKHVYIDTNMNFSGTFVGFAGGLAGKMAAGYVTDCYINISASDVMQNNYPIRDLTETYDDKKDLTNNYSFIKKSIKNIGGICGSLTVGNNLETTLMGVNSYFENQMDVILPDDENLVYTDYYFDNRYGGIAAIVEYNSCNISDLWYYNSEIAAKFNDITEYMPYYDSLNIQEKNMYDVNSTEGNRSIGVYSCNFNYAEDSKHIAATARQVSNIIENDSTFDYGVSSPLFAEIKPTYLSIPSILSTPFYNTSLTVPEGGMVSAERVGLFTMDQLIAAPQSDPNYWSVNLEVDLPGVSNGEYLLNWDQEKGWKYDGYAGGVIDALNKSEGANFSLDITDIATKLVKWQNTTVKSNVYNSYDSYFATVTVPAAAKIEDSKIEKIAETLVGLDVTEIATPYLIPKLGDGINLPTMTTDTNVWLSYRAKLNSWNGNKKIMTYPYFGSDIAIIPNTLDEGNNGERDTLDLTQNFYDYVELIFTNVPYQEEAAGPDGEAHLNVDQIKIQIKRGAFEYVPFGTKQFNTVDEIDSLYKVEVHISKDAGHHDAGDWVGTSLWRWRQTENPSIPDSSKSYGGGANGISHLQDFWHDYEDTQKLVTDWLDEYANGARWGWYFYIDWDYDGSNNYFFNLFLAFDTKPYDRTSESGCFPPNWPFIVGYVCGISSEDYSGGAKWWTSFYNKPASLYNKSGLPLWPKNCTVKFYRNGESGPEQVYIDESTYANICPKYFTELNKVGYFKNSLLRSKASMPTGITQEYDAPVIMRQSFDKDAWYDKTMPWLKYNVDEAMAMIEKEEQVKTYFKYTYTRKNVNINTTDIYPAHVWHVKYDYYNNKAGFWFENEKAPYEKEYQNDKFTYSENYLTMGMTVNEQCILRYLEDPKIQRSGFPLTAFSADDFEGIYVTDSENNPVMYIDVGMGECSPGTTWSYKCYANYSDDKFPEPDEGKTIKGLLLEVNSDDIPVQTTTEEDE